MALRKTLFSHVNKCNKTSITDISSYINFLKKKEHLLPRTSIYFKMAIYLTHSIANSIFESFDQYFSSANYAQNKHKSYFEIQTSIEVDSKKKQKLTFTVSNADELGYALYLAELNKLVIQPFFKENHQKLVNKSENIKRLFFIAIDNINRTGKSIHHSQSSEFIDLHFGLKYSPVKKIDFDYGHLSHFRNTYWFDNASIAVSDIYFDVNYFACYCMPFLNHLEL